MKCVLGHDTSGKPNGARPEDPEPVAVRVFDGAHWHYVEDELRIQGDQTVERQERLMSLQEHAFADVADVRGRLRETGYLADEAIATTVFLADRLRKPLLVEGPAGTGKTELAKALAASVGAELIRLQCYEGLDEARALYEWNYKKQLLRIQAGTGEGSDAA